MGTVEWFKNRWKALGDVTDLLSVASPEYRNPDKYLEDLILNEPNKNLAERRLSMLEDMLISNEEDRKTLELQKVRMTRNDLLAETDKTQLPDFPLDSKEKGRYRKYRQYLRDLPKLINTGKIISMSVLTYEDWNKWIESVRHTPGFETFIP